MLLPGMRHLYPEKNDEQGCPVCMLRRVLEPVSESEPGLLGYYGPSGPAEGCFDHYEIARRDDGTWERRLRPPEILRCFWQVTPAKILCIA
jgi:hypothetical protein